MTKEQRNKKIYERSIEPYGAKRPQPPDASANDVWARVRALVASEEASIENSGGEEPKQRKRGSDRRRRRFRRRIRFYDVIALLVWVSVLTKLFIADVDRLVVSAVAPEVTWLLDYRIVLVLLLLAMVLLLFKARHIAGAVSYVAAYPVVIVFWKIPRFVVKRRAFRSNGMWLAVAIVNMVAAWTARGKWIILAIAIMTTSSLIVLLSHSPLAIYAAAIAMLATLGWSLTVRAIDMLRSSQFITAQRRMIAWILDKKFLDRFLTPKHPNKLTLREWTLEEATAYRDTAGNAVLLHRGLWFWAYAIDQYRRGPALVILNIAAIVFMLAQVVFVFSFVNAGIFIADPAQFQTSGAPEWWTWIYYSGSAMTFGEIDAVTPVGGLATIAKILNGWVGGIGILTIVATFVISFRTARTDDAADGSVRMLEKKLEDIEALSEGEYRSGIDELEAHLVSTAWGLHMVSGWLFAKLPAEWRLEREGISTPPPR